MRNLIQIVTLLLLTLPLSGLSPEMEPTTTRIAAAAKTDKKEDKEFIPWLHERMLEWEDFQSAPNRKSDAVASTSTSLGLAYQLKNRQLSFSITCAFSKSKSWGTLKTDYILAHEQGHFDITEIYARKLHQALSFYRFNPKTYGQDINRIYQRIVKEKEHFQNLYDGQSDHSRNKRIQANWAEIIDTLLVETEPFANYP